MDEIIKKPGVHTLIFLGAIACFIFYQSSTPTIFTTRNRTSSFLAHGTTCSTISTSNHSSTPKTRFVTMTTIVPSCTNWQRAQAIPLATESPYGIRLQHEVLQYPGAIPWFGTIRLLRPHQHPEEASRDFQIT